MKPERSNSVSVASKHHTRLQRTFSELPRIPELHGSVESVPAATEGLSYPSWSLPRKLRAREPVSLYRTVHVDILLQECRIVHYCRSVGV